MQLFVIGMHRSGTSAAARCLNLLGAYFGPESSSMGANAENPKGFWERRDVRELNDSLLHAADADWDRISEFSIDRIPDDDRRQTEREIASLLLELDTHQPWFIKEPRLSLTFPVWRTFATAAVGLHVYRHPLEVALSLRKRNGFSIALGLALWERYMLAGFAATYGLPRIMIFHRDLLTSPWNTTRQLLAELEDVGVSGLHAPARQVVEAFIEPQLYHHRITPKAAFDHLHSAQLELVEMIESKAILDRAPEALPALSPAAADLLAAHDINQRETADLKRERKKLQEKVVAREKTLEDRSWKFANVLNGLKRTLEEQRKSADAKKRTLERREQQLKQIQDWKVSARATIEKRNQQIAALSTQTEKLKDKEKALQVHCDELRRQTREAEDRRSRAEAQSAQTEIWRRETAKQLRAGFDALDEWVTCLVGNYERILQSFPWRIGCWVSFRRSGSHSVESRRFARLLEKKPKPSRVSEKLSKFEQGMHSGETPSSNPECSTADTRTLTAVDATSIRPEQPDNAPQNPEVGGSPREADTASIAPGAAAKVMPRDSNKAKAPERMQKPDADRHSSRHSRDSLTAVEATMIADHSDRTSSSLQSSPSAKITADIVVCIHDALDDVSRCLASVVSHWGPACNSLILVNDGSSRDTADYLNTFAEQTEIPCRLFQNAEPHGYTRAANRGLRASAADYVVLLNSDTVVTPAWVERIIACGESDPAIGIVGPLSNAASWQSIPHRFGDNGDWAVNPLPLDRLPRLSRSFTLLQSPVYPKVPIVNGFCFALKRKTIDRIGFFDEALFAAGYGEENDYCLRAGRAGIKIAIADDCFVFHAKSRSYSHETRRSLAKRSQNILREKYGGELEEATQRLRDSAELARARSLFARVIDADPCLVLFLCPFRSAGGGTNSIIQEATGLRELGVAVQVAIRSQDEEFYRERFPGVPNDLFYRFDNVDKLIDYGGSFEFVVATFFTSVRFLQQILERYPNVIPCYYVQDYEPSFFHRSDSSYGEALQSYKLIPAIHCFAKTDWICETVRREQGITVQKVEPSIDHVVFFPDDTVKPGQPFVIGAMVRPMTERRSPGLTLEILDRIKREYGSAVEIRLFGIEPGDPYLYRRFSVFQHTVLGVLTREAVASLLRSSSLFIDASAYQAFGRTGLEAMACRCATILPRGCGIDEYAVDGINTLLADPEDAGEFVENVQRYMQSRGLYESILERGLETASRYSIEKACRSELEFFTSVRQASGVAHTAAQGNCTS